MLILVAILLALIPTVFILWPFIARLRRSEFEYDEGAPQADLMRRWDAAVANLAGAELDHALGNLSDDDHADLRRRLMTEAAAIMQEMELTQDEEERMLADLSDEVAATPRPRTGRRLARAGLSAPRYNPHTIITGGGDDHPNRRYDGAAACRGHP